MTPAQPARLPSDPGVIVSRLGDDHLTITVGDKALKVSVYNAWRVFGLLACMLGIRLPRALEKGIRL